MMRLKNVDKGFDCKKFRRVIQRRKMLPVLSKISVTGKGIKEAKNDSSTKIFMTKDLSTNVHLHG